MDILLILLIVVPLVFDIKYLLRLRAIVLKYRETKPNNAYYTWIDSPYALVWMLVAFNLLLLPTLSLFVLPRSLTALAILRYITMCSHYLLQLYKVKGTNNKETRKVKAISKKSIKRLTYTILGLLTTQSIFVLIEMRK